MDEIWKDIPGYEGIYQITQNGAIKSCSNLDSKGRVNPKKGKVLKPQKTIYGYYNIVLRKDGKSKSFPIHRLVLYTFNPVKNMKNLQVNHINWNKTDNRLLNLEWVTPKENMNKLNPNKIRYNSIECYDQFGNRFNSYAEAAKYYKISPNTVKNNVIGKYKKR